jgi:cytochrome c oxidase assembly protein subunit 15
VAILIYITAASAVVDGRFDPPVDAPAGRLATLAAGSVLALLLVGSYVSGRGAGAAFPDWPLMNGKLIPDLGNQLYAIHFLHRALAVVVGAVVAAIAWQTLKRKGELPLQARFAHAAIGLFVLEVAIGAANVWTGLNAAFVTAHLLVGALIWGSLVSMAIVSHPILRTVPAHQGGRSQPAFEGG